MDGCFGWLARWLLPPEITYEEAQQRVCSLDLVYFCQFSKWTGPFVAAFSARMITHMGVAWRHPDTQELYLLESIRNGDSAPDVITGTVHTGVRMVSFRNVLNDGTHGPFVCIQPVKMTRALRERAEEAFNHFILRVNGVPFEQHFTSYLFTQLPRSWRLHMDEDTSSLYCSELAALALRDCGLLRGVDNVSCVFPSTFYTCQLVLEPGARLSANKFLIRPGTAPRLPPPRARPEESAAAAAAGPSLEDMLATLKSSRSSYAKGRGQ